MSVLLVDVDEGNNERVCDDVLDMEKIITAILELLNVKPKDERQLVLGLHSLDN
jgi:hypothetical protein